MILAPVELDVKQWDAGVGRTLLSAADDLDLVADLRLQCSSHLRWREPDACAYIPTEDAER